MPSFRCVATVAVAAFLSLPALAHASHQHDLQFQRVEVTRSIPPGGPVSAVRATCPDPYRAMSGSIRVDSVPGGVLTNVLVKTSTPDSRNPRVWLFELVNTARDNFDDASVKLMVSCVNLSTTGGSGEQHRLVIGRNDGGSTIATTSAGSFQPLDCDAAGGSDPFAYIPSGAGWVFDPVDGYSQLLGVIPTGSTYQGGTAWYPTGTLNFAVLGTPAAPYDLYTTAYCLKHLTEVAFGEDEDHQHYINASQQTVSVSLSPTGGGYASQNVSCPSSTFAMAPVWYAEPGAVAAGLRVVGIGYQGDKDVFKLVNPSQGRQSIVVGVICLGTKTSSTTGPTPGAGPGAQQLLISEESVPMTVDPRKTARGALRCDDPTDYVSAAGLDGPGAAAVAVQRWGGGRSPTVWRYALRNPSRKGPARISVELKCLSPWAQGHTLVVDALPARATDGVKSCEANEIAIRPSSRGGLDQDPRYLCLNELTTQVVNHAHRLNTTTLEATIRSRGAVTCPMGSQAIVPRTTAADGARLVRSVPKGRRWSFRFAGGSTASHVRVTCLEEGTTPEIAQPISQPTA